MANGRYTTWLEPDGLLRLQAWAREGLTDVQLAHNVGITVATLYVWKKRFPEIDEALKRGKDVVDIEVENALHRKALAGDVTAMIFWLKNRRPDRWRDRADIAHQFAGDFTLEITGEAGDAGEGGDAGDAK